MVQVLQEVIIHHLGDFVRKRCVAELYHDTSRDDDHRPDVAFEGNVRHTRIVSHVKQSTATSISLPIPLFVARERAHLLRSIYQRFPLNPRHEVPHKVRVKLGLVNLDRHAVKPQRKVVGRAALGVTCKKVVCNEPNHGASEWSGDE